jgi:hypothetical protein
MDAPLVAIDVPWVGDQRLKTWAKIVTNVDETLATGWAYEGEFVAVGGIQDLPAGGILLVYGEKGSRANPMPVARAFTVNADGTLSSEAEAEGKAWARTVRDKIAELVAGEIAIDQLDWAPDLMRYQSKALIEELERRGISFDS